MAGWLLYSGCVDVPPFFLCRLLECVFCRAAGECGDGAVPVVLRTEKLGVFVFLISDVLKLTTKLILLGIFHGY